MKRFHPGGYSVQNMKRNAERWSFSAFLFWYGRLYSYQPRLSAAYGARRVCRRIPLYIRGTLVFQAEKRYNIIKMGTDFKAAALFAGYNNKNK